MAQSLIVKILISLAVILLSGIFPILYLIYLDLKIELLVSALPVCWAIMATTVYFLFTIGRDQYENLMVFKFSGVIKSDYNSGQLFSFRILFGQILKFYLGSVCLSLLLSMFFYFNPGIFKQLRIDQLTDSVKSGKSLELAARYYLNQPRIIKLTESFQSGDIIVVRGEYDSVIPALKALNVKFLEISPVQISDYTFIHQQLFFIDCPGKVTESDALKILDRVANGGTLVSTCWAGKYFFGDILVGLYSASLSFTNFYGLPAEHSELSEAMFQRFSPPKDHRGRTDNLLKTIYGSGIIYQFNSHFTPLVPPNISGLRAEPSRKFWEELGDNATNFEDSEDLNSEDLNYAWLADSHLILRTVIQILADHQIRQAD